MKNLPPLGKVMTDSVFKSFSGNPNDPRKTVKLSELAKKMLDEERAALKGEDHAPDQNVDHVHEEHPAKVEDKIEKVTEKEIPQTHDKNKVKSPAKAKGNNVASESKHKNLKLTGMVPAKVTRNKKDESPKVNTESLSDDTDMEEVKESDFDKKHFAETIDWINRLNKLKERTEPSGMNEDDWNKRRDNWNKWKKDNNIPKSTSTNKDTAYASGRSWPVAKKGKYDQQKYGAKNKSGKVRYFNSNAAADRYSGT